MRIEHFGDATLYNGHVLEYLREMPDESVHCAMTSPPYWGLRRYLPESIVRLRPDLTESERTYVLAELRRLGLLCD